MPQMEGDQTAPALTDEKAPDVVNKAPELPQPPAPAPAVQTAAPPPAPTPSAPSPDCRRQLLADAIETANAVRKHLNSIAPGAHRNAHEDILARWNRLTGAVAHPVRIKNLQKAAAHLQVLQDLLTDPDTVITPDNYTVMSSLLSELKATHQLSFDQAWETADLLEGELIRLGSHDYIRGVWLTWPRERIPDSLRDMTVQEKDKLEVRGPHGALEKYVRPWLLEDQRDLVQEFRRDRAMIYQRRSYLNVMGVVLLILNILFIWLFAQFGTAGLVSQVTSAPAGSVVAMGALRTILLLAMVTGAIGSVVARATRLSHQPLPSDPQPPPSDGKAAKGEELPLGVRSLMTAASVFFAQLMLGATAALIVYLIFASGLVAVEGLKTPTPATLVVMSFVAGFSEPFLTDVVGGISKRTA